MGHRQPKAAKIPSAIGDGNLKIVLASLTEAQVRTVAVMTKYEKSPMETLQMLFPQDVIDRVQAATGLVRTTAWCTYDLGVTPYAPFDRVQLSIRFDSQTWMPAIVESALRLDPDLLPPLAKHVSQVRQIHNRFEEAKAAIKWLDRYGSLGAMRYYLPAIVRLCPSLQMGEIRVHRTPGGVAPWIAALRNAAVTIAETAFLPRAGTRSTETQTPQMHLTLRSNSVRVAALTGSVQAYISNQMMYAL